MRIVSMRRKGQEKDLSGLRYPGGGGELTI